MEKLLPCPFCGSDNIEEDASSSIDYHGHEHQDYEIICKDCKACIDITTGSYKDHAFSCSCCHDIKGEAYRRWNNRVNNIDTKSKGD